MTQQQDFDRAYQEIAQLHSRINQHQGRVFSTIQGFLLGVLATATAAYYGFI